MKHKKIRVAEKRVDAESTKTYSVFIPAEEKL